MSCYGSNQVRAVARNKAERQTFEACVPSAAGSYVICEVPEVDEGTKNPEKQQGEIMHVLYKDQIKHLVEEKLWCVWLLKRRWRREKLSLITLVFLSCLAYRPEEFNPEGPEGAAALADGEGEEGDEEEEAFMTFGKNPNQVVVYDSSSDEEGNEEFF